MNNHHHMNAIADCEQVEVECSNNESCRCGRPRFFVRSFLLTDPILRQHFLGHEIEGHFFSPGGGFFCSRACWASFCDD